MLLGVDAGGTSTRAVLLEETGRGLGYGVAGGGNPISWGPQRAAKAICSAVGGALAQAGGGSVSGAAVLAMAGGSVFSETGPIESALRSLGLRCSVTVVSDLLATFCAGTPALQGYGLVAGTGAAAIRVRDGSVDASADGLGWLLGDGGSGFWIGRRVARAALAALDGRGPATPMTGMVLDELGVVLDDRRDASGRPAALQAVVDALYRWRPVELSRFAALAFRAAGVDAGGGGGGDRGGDGDRGDGCGDGDRGGDGDPIAASILTAARGRLVDTLRAVRRDDIVGPVVLGGGIARRLPGLVAAIAGSGGGVAAETAGAAGSVTADATPHPVVTVADGVVGAAVLTLRRAGVAVDPAVFDRLTTSVVSLRG